MTPRCVNGGCRRPSTIEIQVGIRSSDWRPVCRPCAEALAGLYPEQRQLEPGQPEWVRRARENALPLRIDTRDVA